MINQELVINLIELRKRIIYILIGLLIVFIPLFKFANQLYDILAKPLLRYMPVGTQLIATDITSPFFVPLKLALLCTFVISLPNTVYQIWQYTAPAMFRHEKRMIIVTFICVTILFALGIGFCYYVVLPVIFKFIGNIKSSDILMMTDIGKYADFVLDLFLVFGICFQTPIIVFLIIYFNLVNYVKIKKLRPYIFVGCFIIAAILTPPDVISQTLLAIPLYLLYELGLLISLIIKNRDATL
ncbi:MAG: twin-arginine translocase subunit TatC [Proteobacteria bacterium]|jgi:sec-independent protein translocase protein TatC|nr:twin-arginine translocase subunit TatC [Pseudomonadota bacterium]